MKALVTVIGHDKVGIIAGVCSTPGGRRHQRSGYHARPFMEGYFTMMMVVDLTAVSGALRRTARRTLKDYGEGLRPVHPHPAGGHLRRHAQAVQRAANDAESCKISSTPSRMIDQQHLDIRTITMGISLLRLRATDPEWSLPARSTTRSARHAETLVQTG